jgi:hypothetical protein
MELCLQWDPHPFLFRSPARYDTSVCTYSSIDLLQIPCQTLLISAPRLAGPQLPLQQVCKVTSTLLWMKWSQGMIRQLWSSLEIIFKCQQRFRMSMGFAHWTTEDEKALLLFLIDHKAEGDSGSFKKATWNAAAIDVNKQISSCKSIFEIILIVFHLCLFS